MDTSIVELAIKNKMELAKSKLALNIEEVALLSGLHISTIRRFCNDGRIKYKQAYPHGKLMFDAEYIKEWIKGTI